MWGAPACIGGSHTAQPFAMMFDPMAATNVIVWTDDVKHQITALTGAAPFSLAAFASSASRPVITPPLGEQNLSAYIHVGIDGSLVRIKLDNVGGSTSTVVPNVPPVRDLAAAVITVGGLPVSLGSLRTAERRNRPPRCQERQERKRRPGMASTPWRPWLLGGSLSTSR
jgi:hypothetical protein